MQRLEGTISKLAAGGPKTAIPRQAGEATSWIDESQRALENQGYKPLIGPGRPEFWSNALFVRIFHWLADGSHVNMFKLRWL